MQNVDTGRGTRIILFVFFNPVCTIYSSVRKPEQLSDVYTYFTEELSGKYERLQNLYV